jgi:AcrR family transcriptional regulator
MKKRSMTPTEKLSKKRFMVQTAMKLFFENKTMPSVNQIIKEADIAKGTVYLYFKTKEEIFLEALRQQYNIWFQDMERKLTLHNNLDAKTIAAALSRFPAKNPRFVELAKQFSTVIEGNLDAEKLEVFRDELSKKFEHITHLIFDRSNFTREETHRRFFISYSLMQGIWQTLNLDNANFDQYAGLEAIWSQN